MSDVIDVSQSVLIPENAEMALHFLEVTGIKKYLDKDGITEIVVDRAHQIGIETSDGWQYFDEENATLTNLMHLVNALTTYNSLPRISADSPIRSLVLPNGERSQVIIAPATLTDISITIRKPSKSRFTIADYVNSGRFNNVNQAEIKTAELTDKQVKMFDLYLQTKDDPSKFIDFINLCVESRANFLIVGGTGSGKTTVAKAIADIFPKDRRIITVEDVHEMTLPLHKNKVHLFYKHGIVAPKFLIESAMRMKPDHIFLAELRGDEAWSYIEALNTGHEGSITTIHANDCYSAFSRLASIVKQSEVGMTLDYNLILNTIKTSIDVIMYFEKTHLREIYFNPLEKNKILARG